jgi:salicylate hydroxylase
VSVTLADGERLYADLVVGADGPDSVVRTEVMGEQITGERDGHLSLSIGIPTELMMDDDDLRPLTKDGNVSGNRAFYAVLLTRSQWWAWFGPSLVLHGSLVVSPFFFLDWNGVFRFHCVPEAEVASLCRRSSEAVL